MQHLFNRRRVVLACALGCAFTLSFLTHFAAADVVADVWAFVCVTAYLLACFGMLAFVLVRGVGARLRRFGPRARLV